MGLRMSLSAFGALGGSLRPLGGSLPPWAGGAVADELFVCQGWHHATRLMPSRCRLASRALSGLGLDAGGSDKISTDSALRAEPWLLPALPPAWPLGVPSPAGSRRPLPLCASLGASLGGPLCRVGHPALCPRTPRVLTSPPSPFNAAQPRSPRRVPASWLPGPGLPAFLWSGHGKVTALSGCGAPGGDEACSGTAGTGSCGTEVGGSGWGAGRGACWCRGALCRGIFQLLPGCVEVPAVGKWGWRPLVPCWV